MHSSFFLSQWYNSRNHENSTTACNLSTDARRDVSKCLTWRMKEWKSNRHSNKYKWWLASHWCVRPLPVPGSLSVTLITATPTGELRKKGKAISNKELDSLLYTLQEIRDGNISTVQKEQHAREEHRRPESGRNRFLRSSPSRVNFATGGEFTRGYQTWRVSSSGIRRRVVCWVITEVSEEYIASIFRVEYFFDPQDGSDVPPKRRL
jgi:hypothetical protein